MDRKQELQSIRETSRYRELVKGEQSLTFTASSPSNIALVKYWGKREGEGVQIPANPSLSLTLERARTYACLKIGRKKDLSSPTAQMSLLFEGKEKPSFLPKIETFFSRVGEYLPFLHDFSFAIETRNTFPHSAGVASSASSMSAMAMGLVDFENWLLEEAPKESFKETSKETSKEKFLRERASFLSRLGSGSACRSLYPKMALWGEIQDLPPSSDLRACPITFHESLEGLHDTILIVDSRQKSVSSRDGHNLMRGHPFAQSRFRQGRRNALQALSLLKEGNWEKLGEIIEEEALSLHAMMMTSKPGYLLMNPETISLIEKVRSFRLETKTPLYFTLDAGPNLHLLYPKNWRKECLNFIEELQSFFPPGSITLLDDRMGEGTRREGQGQ